MAKSYEVLNMLLPEGGYYQNGIEYEGIVFVECEPITKEEFLAGFEKYDAWKVEQDTIQAKKKADILKRLGLTEDEAKLILS